MNTLGARIKQLRTEKGLRQEDLAKTIMVNRATLASWEVDRALPDVNIIQKIADVFGITVDFLLGRKPPESTNSLDERASNLSKENQQVIEKILRSLEIEEQIKEEKEGTDQGR
jgi:transcriptional regulator with XRE-family HTH domain